MGTEKLDAIFNPRRIAVIGASDREGSIGAKLLRNLIGVGYKGAVYPVNPFRSTVQGITAYPSIKKTPGKVDLAVVATPAHTVPQIIEECGEAGVSGVIITSAGFKGCGEEGEVLEKQILTNKNRYNMRILGPNSLGVMRPRINLNASITSKSAMPGKIAFISQSAALCTSVLEWASEANIGFSAVISTGSMLDVNLGDLIDYFGSDAQTRSVVLFVESIKDAREFMSAARGFARAKPIVVVRAGRFRESAEATFSHTGSLSGEDAVYDAAFRRAGIVRVEEISDLFNCAEALAMQPNPKGPNLTIITNAGGPGITATDQLIAMGGKLSPLSSEILQALKDALPFYCSAMNPVDILEEANLNRFKRAMEICFKDPNSDGFLIIYTPQGVVAPIAIAKAIKELSRQTAKPILTSLIGEDECWRARRILRKNGIPTFTTAEQAVSTFMYMYRYTQNLELLYQTPEELSVETSNPASLKEILRRAFNEGREVLTLSESMQFLDAYKIPTIKTLVAKTPGEATTAASEMGYPIVMKALSPQITHKSKADLVILNVCSPEETIAFFTKLAERVANEPKAEFDGIAIQPMLQRGRYELLIGSKKDPQFGSVIVFGMGGVTAELLKDTSIGFPPLNRVLARRLMEKTKIYEALESGGYSLGIKLLEEILVKFSQLVIDFPEIKEVEINPLIIDKKNVAAVDARIVPDPVTILHEPSPYGHLVIAPYPKKYITKWILRDGTAVILRPIKPEDEILLDEFFKSLSEETMRLRFFRTIKYMSHETLTRYCNIDYGREMAIVAEIQGDKKKKIIGVAQLISEAGGKSREFALVIGDQWQGLGLGTRLTDYTIEIGKDMMLKTIYGYLLPNNSMMLKIFERKGFKMEPYYEDLVKATLDLT
jgi:acetyltransferase